MVEEMRIRLPGLLKERMASGQFRYRVRVKGDKAKRILLPCTPDHPEFLTIYHAARDGEKPALNQPENAATKKSVAWLSLLYEKAMQERVAAGLMHASTRHQRTAFYMRLRAAYGEKHMDMPRSAVIGIRDSISSTPGAADNMVKAIRALYAWGIENGHVSENPANNIGKINRGTGAIPWSIDDLQKFRDKHQIGTMAHLALTLFMFSACRIGDAPLLGRANELQRDGLTWLDWQPAKRGSIRVTIPILPPLKAAIGAQKVIGPTYLLTSWGRSFSSSAAFGNWFRDKVREAGLVDRSPHGIRKAAGELMALEGATQYHIMAVHGHTQAKTSEVYTAGVNRVKLAGEAMKTMSKMKW